MSMFFLDWNNIGTARLGETSFVWRIIFENGWRWLAVVMRGVSREELGDYYVVNVEVAFYE
jgi:hypothetical protein